MHYRSDMTKTFREALLEAISATETSVKKIAEASGVSYEQLKKVVQRETSSTNVDDAVKVANAFGLTLTEFLDDRTAQDRVELAKLYMTLRPDELRILRAAAAGVRVLEDRMQPPGRAEDSEPK